MEVGVPQKRKAAGRRKLEQDNGKKAAGGRRQNEPKVEASNKRNRRGIGADRKRAKGWRIAPD
jgi:hypothetical protein